MSAFPRLTETFVLYEIIAVEELGLTVDVYPLRRERTIVVHPEAEHRMDTVRFTPFVSPRIVFSQLWWLQKAPLRYLRTLWDVIRGTWGSLNFFFGGLAIFPKVTHVARAMAADGVGHVHCHFANHPALAGFIVHRLTSIPYSFTAHGSDLLVDRHMLAEKVADAAFVVAISRYNRDLIVRESRPADAVKVKVVHCGVDTNLFAPEAHRRGDELALLCVGRLAAWKGQEHLVDACRLLAERGVSFHCTIAGGAGDRSALVRRIHEAGLADRVEVVGWKTRREVAQLMQRADVVATPSVQVEGGKQEGIPVTLMEAMSTGAAVVASAITGIPELVEDGVNGLLVPPGDPDALAAALARLAADPDLRRRFGTAGREKVLEEFELRANASELVRLISEGV